jgi:hypothetical protein
MEKDTTYLAGHGLVEQDDLGLGHERHAEVEELLLAVGQVGGEIVCDVRELQEVEEPQGALLGFGTPEEPAEHGAPTFLRGHQEGFQHGHLGEELDELKGPRHRRWTTGAWPAARHQRHL